MTTSSSSDTGQARRKRRPPNTLRITKKQWLAIAGFLSKYQLRLEEDLCWERDAEQSQNLTEELRSIQHIMKAVEKHNFRTLNANANANRKETAEITDERTK